MDRDRDLDLDRGARCRDGRDGAVDEPGGSAGLDEARKSVSISCCRCYVLLISIMASRLASVHRSEVSSPGFPRSSGDRHLCLLETRGVGEAARFVVVGPREGGEEGKEGEEVPGICSPPPPRIVIISG